jgi:hypothetical protein
MNADTSVSSAASSIDRSNGATAELSSIRDSALRAEETRTYPLDSDVAGN